MFIVYFIFLDFEGNKISKAEKRTQITQKIRINANPKYQQSKSQIA